MELKNLIDRYEPSDQTLALVKEVDLLLIAGIDGGGKNTVNKQLLKNPKYH